MPDPIDINSRRRRGGPKTLEGKARSSLNALKHGRYSRFATLLASEDAAEFESLFASLLDRFQPRHPHEAHLLRQLASLEWRKLRYDSIETRILDSQLAARHSLALARGLPHDPDLELQRALDDLLANSRILQFLSTRLARLTHERDALLRQLERCRRAFPTPDPQPQPPIPTPSDPPPDPPPPAPSPRLLLTLLPIPASPPPPLTRPAPAQIPPPRLIKPLLLRPQLREMQLTFHLKPRHKSSHFNRFYRKMRLETNSKRTPFHTAIPQENRHGIVPF